MFKSSIKVSDLDDALAALERLGSRGNHALARALNDAAAEGVKALQAHAHDVFDRPTKFTINAFRIDYAKPSRTEAAVAVKDEKSGAGRAQAPEDWFEPQVFGGSRRLKNSERRLRNAGILPGNKFIAPGPDARLDAHGNISRGHIQQILSGLRVENPSGSNIAATNSRRSLRKGHAQAFFVMRKGKKPIGIAERRGKQLSIVLLFVSHPRYTPRFEFHKVLRQEVAENDALLEAAINRAITHELSR